MKTFKATIEIEGLGGKRTIESEIKARTEKSALNKAYLIIGNQSGHVVSLIAK